MISEQNGVWKICSTLNIKSVKTLIIKIKSSVWTESEDENCVPERHQNWNWSYVLWRNSWVKEIKIVQIPVDRIGLCLRFSKTPKLRISSHGTRWKYWKFKRIWFHDLLINSPYSILFLVISIEERYLYKTFKNMCIVHWIFFIWSVDTNECLFIIYIYVYETFSLIPTSIWLCCIQ